MQRGEKRAGAGAARGSLLAGAVLLGLLQAGPVRAEMPEPPDRPSRNLYGMTGLIDMPSADMQPDAEISLTTGYFGGYMRNTLAFQILPWLEGAFRYSVLEHMEGADGGTLYDRSFDLKLKLIQEGPQWPSVVVGLQDFLGTGVYSGEYIAATKGFLDGDLRVTGGFGWGRFGGANNVHNPLCFRNNRFCSRTNNVNTGGSVDFGQFFSGKTLGFFGGVDWQTPVRNLRLKAELSSDDYSLEQARGPFTRKIPFNFGAEYRLTEGVEVGAYYMYGSEVGLRLSLSGNPFRPPSTTDDVPAPQPLAARPGPKPGTDKSLFGEVRALAASEVATVPFGADGITNVSVETRPDGVRWATAELPPSADYVCPDEDAKAIDAEFGVIDAVTFRHADGKLICTVALRPAGQEAIRRAVRDSVHYPTDWYSDEAKRRQIVEALVERLDVDRLGLYGISIEPERVTVYIENHKFHSMPRAIGRTARALTATMPASVELFEIVPVERGLTTVSVSLRRSALEEQVERPDAARSTWVTAQLGEAKPANWSEIQAAGTRFPRASWSINPTTPVNLFDPGTPVQANLSVAAHGGVELLPGLSVNTTVTKSLFGNLGQGAPESDSELPRVRSDIAKYLRKGDPALSRASVDYVAKLDDGLYGRVSAGLLERMYGGVSGEVLWKPASQNWGFGVEVNWVQQRGYQQLFTFRDYDVVTGHGSFYWDTGWYGVSTEIDAGRYLAGDWGGTFALKRRFANGWEVGGFFTLTDVPFGKFGEGSFDKGLFLTVPLGWFLPIETRSSFSTVLRPLYRDGGQRLSVANRLYDTVEDTDRGGLRANWGSFWQ